MKFTLGFLILAAQWLADGAWGQVQCVGGPIAPGGFNAGTDYFQDASSKVTLKYAKNFDVQYFKFYKEVTVRYPSGPPQKFTLYLCNSNAPSTTAALTIPIPVVNVSVSEHDINVISFLERIGERFSIREVGVPTDRVTSPCMNEYIENNHTTTYTAPAAPTASANLNFGLPTAGTTLPPSLTVIDAIRSEQSPLARAEWVKFFSLFYNAEKNATDIFDKDIEQSYNCIMNSIDVRNYEAMVGWIAAKAPGKANSTTFGSVDTAVTSQLIKDAGGTPIELAAESGRIKLIEAFKQINILIDGTPPLDALVSYTYVDTASNFGFQSFDKFPFGSKGTWSKVFRSDQLRNTKFYDLYPESSWAKPEYVLKDLTQVFAERTPTAAVYKYFRSVVENDNEIVIGSKDCDDPAVKTPVVPFDPAACTRTRPTRPAGDGQSGDGTKPVPAGKSSGGPVGATVGVLLVLFSSVVIYVFRHDIREFVSSKLRGRNSAASGPFDDVWKGNRGIALQ
ncbi:hypothetical protein DFS34DRAFT_697358 [Phlyctochytrium arcticum]|nr:hypothetical protein DFS34DRAFT_697358 [Phlyctochytrium arcticum]